MFSVGNLQLNRGLTTANAQGNSTMTTHTYKDKSNTVANIILAFPPYLDQGTQQDFLKVGDLITINGSDGVQMSEILALEPFTIGPDLFVESELLSVGAPVIATDGNVAQIASNILQMEIADATHPGIITEVSQIFGGIKTFNNGLNTDLINEKTVSNGTTVNGTNIKGNKITFSNPNVSWDDSVSSPNTVRFTVDNNDFISYSKTSEVYSFNVAGSAIGLISSISGIQTNLGFDRISGGNLVIGATVATSITLNKDTTLPAGKILYTNGVDAVGANPLLLGQSNATAISLTQNTAVSFGKLFFSNTLDAVTGTSILIGNSIATGVTLKPLTTSIGGIQFLTSGGTPTTLNYYEELDFTSTFSNDSVTTSSSIDMKLIRIGNNITIHIIDDASLVSSATPSAFFINDSLLPTQFRPTTDTNIYWRVLDNVVSGAGAALITPAGEIKIYRIADYTTAFTPTATIGFYKGSFSYSA